MNKVEGTCVARVLNTHCQVIFAALQTLQLQLGNNGNRYWGKKPLARWMNPLRKSQTWTLSHLQCSITHIIKFHRLDHHFHWNPYCFDIFLLLFLFSCICKYDKCYITYYNHTMDMCVFHYVCSIDLCTWISVGWQQMIHTEWGFTHIICMKSVKYHYMGIP